MTRRVRLGARDALKLLRLATIQVAGRRFWLVPLLPVAWPFVHVPFQLIGWWQGEFTAAGLIPWHVGLPVAVLGAGLGVRVIAAEIEQRTIEIAYTVPGGAARLWTFKLVGAWLLTTASALASTALVHVFLVGVRGDTLLAVLLAGWFHVGLGAWLAALTRSEVTGALACVPVIVIQLFMTSSRFSAFWNPVPYFGDERIASDVLAWTVQSRIGVALATAAVTALALGRAERREKILGG